MPGTLFVVATPIGNLDDVSARAVRVLSAVAVIAAEDTRRTAQLLARYGITTPATSLHEHNESRKAPGLVDRLRRGDDIALVSDAGTPVVSDPGHRFIRAAIQAGVRVEPVPGPSAAIALLSVSGLPSEPFVFLGFPPNKSRAKLIWLKTECQPGRTVIFFEAPHRILDTLRLLFSVFGDCEVAVGRELTKIHEEILRGSLSQVIEVLKEPRGEYTVCAYIGLSIQIGADDVLDPARIFAEFGEITESMGLKRRPAIAELARRHGKPQSAIYQLIETGKKSVVRP